MIGQLLIHALFGTAVTATLFAWMGLRKNDVQLQNIAQRLLGVLAIGLVAAASFLVFLILQHRFDYTYVWNYSSRESPVHLLIAGFYSGQEGSFLLWTLLVAVFGVFVIQYSRRYDYQAQSTFWFGTVLVFLTLLLVAKNPFSYYYESFAAQGISNLAEDIPKDGRGLNPLLHNAWITIHPPILFTGFASMSVAFVFALSGLLKRDYHKWIRVAMPWTLFGTAVLGFGIMLGGFWAYETLGWGGFWGWDPVENSSLIPWLVSVALVHTMLVQQRTRGLVKTNMILAVLAFVTVLYSTFLTRSGILGDTSVHSFVDPGKFAFWILLAFMATFLIAGTVLVLMRVKDMNVHREDFKPTTREFFMGMGAAGVMASAVLVTIGTSWPVIMEIVGQPKVAVATDFYNRVHLILVPAVLIINGLSLIMQWRRTTPAVLRKRALTAVGVATLITAVSWFVLQPTIGLGILMWASWFALYLNITLGWDMVNRSSSMAGAYISHTGIALLMFGVIITASYHETYHAVLTQDVPVQVGKYALTYVGREQVDKERTDKEKYRFLIRIRNGNDSAMVAPVMFWSDFNNRQSPFHEPGIRWGLTRDLYVAPKSIDMEDVYSTTVVMRGTQTRIPTDTSLVMTLHKFTMPMEEEQTPDGRMQMSAILTVVNAKGDTLADAVKATTRIGQGADGPSFEPVWITLPGTQTGIGLAGIQRNNEDPTKSTGSFRFRDMSKPSRLPREQFTVEFSVKPFISLVWVGVITMVLGFAFSIFRYRKLAQQAIALRDAEFAPGTGGDAEVRQTQLADTDTEKP